MRTEGEIKARLERYPAICDYIQYGEIKALMWVLEERDIEDLVKENIKKK